MIMMTTAGQNEMHQLFRIGWEVKKGMREVGKEGEGSEEGEVEGGGMERWWKERAGMMKGGKGMPRGRRGEGARRGGEGAGGREGVRARC